MNLTEKENDENQCEMKRNECFHHCNTIRVFTVCQHMFGMSIRAKSTVMHIRRFSFVSTTCSKSEYKCQPGVCICDANRTKKKEREKVKMLDTGVRVRVNVHGKTSFA